MTPPTPAGALCCIASGDPVAMTCLWGKLRNRGGDDVVEAAAAAKAAETAAAAFALLPPSPHLLPPPLYSSPQEGYSRCRSSRVNIVRHFFSWVGGASAGTERNKRSEEFERGYSAEVEADLSVGRPHADGGKDMSFHRPGCLSTRGTCYHRRRVAGEVAGERT